MSDVKPWREEYMVKVLELRAQGKSYQYIADYLEIAQSTVIARAHDKKDCRARIWTQEKIDKLIEFRNKGMNYKNIGLELNIAESTVYFKVRELKRKGLIKNDYCYSK